MITNNQKTSLLVASQLPEFIRDNPSYEKFVLFLQAYYEWLEQNNNVVDRTKNILNYLDVDNTTDEFINYFINDFLPYFPQEIAADQRKLLKAAREFYVTKGSENSLKFLLLFLKQVNLLFWPSLQQIYPNLLCLLQSLSQ